MSTTIDLTQLNTAMELVEKHYGESDTKLLTNLTITMQELLHGAETSVKHANTKTPEAQRIQSNGSDIIKFDDNKLATQMDNKMKILLQKVSTLSEPKTRQEIKDAILKINPKLSVKTASNDPKLPPSSKHQHG